MVMAKNDSLKPPMLPPRPLPTLPPVLPDPHSPGCHTPIKPPPSEFDVKDKNDDGKLNADEFNEGRGLIDKLTDPKKFDRYDADNDGYVTKKENFSGELRDAIMDHKISKVGLPDWKGPKLAGAPKDPGAASDPKPE